jgi:hypothetical protein
VGSNPVSSRHAVLETDIHKTKGANLMVQPSAVETIAVLQVGKYGVRVDEKTWYGVNEPLTPSHFTPQQTYKVSISVSKTGKKYIKEVLGVSETPVSAPAPAETAPAVDKERAQHYTPPATTKEAPKTLDAKTIQIQRQGCWQAAIQSPALTTWAVNVDEYLAIVRKAADAGVRYVNEA